MKPRSARPVKGGGGLPTVPPYLAVYRAHHLGRFDTAWDAGCAVTRWLRGMAAMSGFAFEANSSLAGASCTAEVGEGSEGEGETAPAAQSGRLQWLTIDPFETEEDAEARAEAELATEREAEEVASLRAKAATWRPKEGTIRARIFEKMVAFAGVCQRERLAKAIVSSGGLQHKDVVDVLRKEMREKKAREPPPPLRPPRLLSPPLSHPPPPPARTGSREGTNPRRRHCALAANSLSPTALVRVADPPVVDRGRGHCDVRSDQGGAHGVRAVFRAGRGRRCGDGPPED